MNPITASLWSPQAAEETAGHPAPDAGPEHSDRSTSAWNLLRTLQDLGELAAGLALLKSDLLRLLDRAAAVGADPCTVRRFEAQTTRKNANSSVVAKRLLFERFRRYPWAMERFLCENNEAPLAQLGNRVIAPTKAEAINGQANCFNLKESNATDSSSRSLFWNLSWRAFQHGQLRSMISGAVGLRSGGRTYESPSGAMRVWSGCDSIWRHYAGLAGLQQLAADSVAGDVPHREILVNLAAAVEILGGAAILWKKTARAGAVVLGCLYLFFALTWVPRIAAQPMVYDRWGNFFEQFSLVSGALIAYGMLQAGDSRRASGAARMGYVCFGICMISFTVEQLFI